MAQAPIYLIFLELAGEQLDPEARERALLDFAAHRNVMQAVWDQLDATEGRSSEQHAIRSKQHTADQLVMRAWSGVGELPGRDDVDAICDPNPWKFISFATQMLYNGLTDAERATVREFVAQLPCPEVKLVRIRRELLSDLEFEEESIQDMRALNESFADGTFVPEDC